MYRLYGVVCINSKRHEASSKHQGGRQAKTRGITEDSGNKRQERQRIVKPEGNAAITSVKPSLTIGSDGNASPH